MPRPFRSTNRWLVIAALALCGCATDLATPVQIGDDFAEQSLQGPLRTAGLYAVGTHIRFRVESYDSTGLPRELVVRSSDPAVISIDGAPDPFVVVARARGVGRCELNVFSPENELLASAQAEVREVASLSLRLGSLVHVVPDARVADDEPLLVMERTAGTFVVDYLDASGERLAGRGLLEVGVDEDAPVSATSDTNDERRDEPAMDALIALAPAAMGAAEVRLGVQGRVLARRTVEIVPRSSIVGLEIVVDEESRAPGDDVHLVTRVVDSDGRSVESSLVADYVVDNEDTIASTESFASHLRYRFDGERERPLRASALGLEVFGTIRGTPLY
ncbi:hypothetical protein [Sandaracinus amylolyticus]|uniref:hypothetical protein n=1 Tax=Sandaracinus amylolyticus TaxID=927083 RepID=UPI001F477DF8|nr:hypothetical protein [Sandaracinus amylolyticus]UJR83833.1 Hypothetical protein I5071_59040 [Sandaracinus amylolyticus]